MELDTSKYETSIFSGVRILWLSFVLVVSFLVYFPKS